MSEEIFVKLIPFMNSCTCSRVNLTMWHRKKFRGESHYSLRWPRCDCRALHFTSCSGFSVMVFMADLPLKRTKWSHLKLKWVLSFLCVIFSSVNIVMQRISLLLGGVILCWLRLGLRRVVLHNVFCFEKRRVVLKWSILLWTPVILTWPVLQSRFWHDRTVRRDG